jgi:hypothetical protein
LSRTNDPLVDERCRDRHGGKRRRLKKQGRIETFNLHVSSQANLTGKYHGKRYLYSLFYTAHLAGGLQMSSGQLMVV